MPHSVGNRTLDAYRGVVAEVSSITEAFEDRTFFFCSEICRARFRLEPERYRH